MNISLRRGEKLYLNGAVIRADRKVSIELLNDVTFLLENHVMQEADATTPLRQLYFVIQLMIMSPNDIGAAMELCRKMLLALRGAMDDPRILGGLGDVARNLENRKMFDALKTVRGMFAFEASIMSGEPAASSTGDNRREALGCR